MCASCTRALKKKRSALVIPQFKNPPQISDESQYAVVAGQGDIKKRDKKEGVTELVFMHNTEKYGYLGDFW